MVNLISIYNTQVLFQGSRYKIFRYKNGALNQNKRNEKISKRDNLNEIIKNYNYPLFISFKGGLHGNSNIEAQNSILSLTAKNLVKEYMVQLENNRPWFEARRGNILQPSEIPKETFDMIAEKSLKDMEGIPKNKILYIVSGRIGCGKSTFVRQQKFGEYCYLPDCDDIKPFLPGYKEKDSTYVHLVSSSILAANLYEAFKRGLNVVFQTSTEERFLDTVIEKAKQCGYKKIIMFHINTNEENAINRANQRGLETGRYIKPEVIRKQKYIDDLVSIYKNPQKGLSELFVYDNNSKDFAQVQHYFLNEFDDNKEG